MQTCLPNIQEEKNSQPEGEALPKQTDGRANRPLFQTSHSQGLSAKDEGKL